MWVLLEMAVNILSIRENRRLGPSGNTFPQRRPVVAVVRLVWFDDT